ncbi:protein kinase [Endozoicomonas gorgoniicola]|uniref:Protein kinase n=1 Tax=Endozoicomonas gorgoniicola TaxID=1234144 RepID=A0ABT3MYS4_9GAMM|nr:protein kinase [Endozoicomonas gorgoniicola]MCW7554514.1 protein kinase [Endozoicomonas gorgoniicola]
MAKVIPGGGEPVNEAERLAIRYLRDELPDDYLLMHNFEIQRGRDKFEVDLAVFTPHAIYMVDVKGTRGLIDVYGNKWYPQGRQSFTSPLLKLRGHAKTLKGIITDGHPDRPELRQIYVDATILLTHKNVEFKDPQDRDSANVTTLKEAKRFFCDSSRIAHWAERNIRPHFNLVGKALLGVAKKRIGPLQFGNWEVLERLGGGEGYTEYRAFHVLAGQKAGTAIIKAYEADPYLPEQERQKQLRLIANGFRALTCLPTHPSIAGSREFFTNEDESCYYLVIDDLPGQALRLYLDKPNLALTLDQKFRIAKDLLSALSHAHTHGVVHRNLTPGTLLLAKDGKIRLVGFDFARSGNGSSDTIAGELTEALETSWQAPEVYSDPAKASPESDVFTAGLILYELFTGEQAFASSTELFDQSAEFSPAPSKLRRDLPEGFDLWLQTLCAFKPEDRPTAKVANQALEKLLAPPESTEVIKIETETKPETITPEQEAKPEEFDFHNLKQGDTLNRKFMVQSKLGKGQFGVVYKVIDTLGDVTRAIKLILNDRHSTLNRLKKEYKLLLRLPDHPHVVKVVDAAYLTPGNIPFLVFEYLEGQDVAAMVEKEAFSPEDVLSLAKQTAEGLAHLHKNTVFHCDIKPGNLLWTRGGVKIIDFNVSVDASHGMKQGGGTRRYIPPDIDLDMPPQSSDLADRDLYALGITLYQVLTGRYPWEASAPPPATPAKDPREINGFDELAPEFAGLLLKAISPKRADRFASCSELVEGLGKIKQARRIKADDSSTASWKALGGGSGDNINPYVGHLLTLYSQSPHSNAGTRGLDAFAEKLYVDTVLDRELLPAVLNGDFKLVLITGNAGDGKTAFLQMLEAEANNRKAQFSAPLPNGKRFKLGQQNYLTNYDGSQDEGDQDNQQVLDDFFAPFTGDDGEKWSAGETRLIAINEGRLIDYLTTEKTRFNRLGQIVHTGLETGEELDGVAVVNLNQRSVTAQLNDSNHEGSILKRLIGRMTHEKLWQACEGCSLKDKCYAYHNARTFQDETAATKVIERLETLYDLNQLQDRQHITLRDLRSALTYMLVGTRNCQQIQELYKSGDRETIIQSYYFNSWQGGDLPNKDRLLSQLKTVDIAQAPDPKLDRGLDFVAPALSQGSFGFEQRGHYDLDILARLYDDLPRDYNGKATQHRFQAHQQFVAIAKRRYFFERRDDQWRTMLPYSSAVSMIQLLKQESSLDIALGKVLHAINRGEGLTDARRLGDNLALQVRQVDKGTVRSYRLFSADQFALAIRHAGQKNRFVENQPQGLTLQYKGASGTQAELVINLDVFEMLMRLNEGYRPSVEELQGYYLNLSIFKNLLNSEPYQEVLLTTTGHDFYRVARSDDGRLDMSLLGEGAA